MESRYWKETADFICLVDERFDVMNSSRKLGDKWSRNSFGVYLCKQMNGLQLIIDVMSTMRIKKIHSVKAYIFFRKV